MEHDHTSRALIIIMIIILIIILVLLFIPRGTLYFTSPSTVTVQRSVPNRTIVTPVVETHTYTTTTPVTTYQQQTTTTTEHTTTQYPQ